MSLKHAILAAVSMKPRTGYELGKEIEGSINYFWKSTHQQIYKELGNLEKLEWVSFKEVQQSERPDKKIYKITKSGLNELKTWVATEAEIPTAKDELLIKLFAGHWVPQSVLLGVIEKQYLKRSERLQKYVNIESTHFQNPNDLDEEYRFQYLTLRRGIIFEKGWLSWADETIAFLKRRSQTL